MIADADKTTVMVRRMIGSFHPQLPDARGLLDARFKTDFRSIESDGHHKSTDCVRTWWPTAATPFGARDFFKRGWCSL